MSILKSKDARNKVYNLEARLVHSTDQIKSNAKKSLLVRVHEEISIN